MALDDETVIRCSNSCTRSGLTALLLSALAISTIQVLAKARALDALLNYVQLRIRLEVAITQLDSDPCWEDLKRGEAGRQPVEKLTLFELRDDYQCRAVFEGDDQSNPADESLPSGRPIKSYTVFRPGEQRDPSGTRPFGWPVIEIIETVAELRQPDLLDLAMSHSYTYDVSIRRWRVLWASIESRKLPTEEEGKEIKSQKLTSLFLREYSLKRLTMENVRRLSKYQMPELRDMDLIVKRQETVTLPWIGAPVELIASTIFLEFALLFCVMYFWLYYREAQVIGSCFPMPGTIFGVFKRTRGSRIIFVLLVMVPPITAGLLAYRSFQETRLNSGLAILILVFSTLILRWQRQPARSAEG